MKTSRQARSKGEGMTSENQCPVAEQIELGDYTITPDGTLVESSDVEENPTAFTDIIN